MNKNQTAQALSETKDYIDSAINKIEQMNNAISRLSSADIEQIYDLVVEDIDTAIHKIRKTPIGEEIIVKLAEIRTQINSIEKPGSMKNVALIAKSEALQNLLEASAQIQRRLSLL